MWGVLGVRCAGGDARGDGVDIGAGWGTRVGEGNLGVQFSPIERSSKTKIESQFYCLKQRFSASNC